MKKIILLIPLMLLSAFEKSDCMHRRSMKKVHMRKGHQRKRGFQFRKNEKVARREEVRPERKVGLVDSLCAPEKSFSISSFVPRVDLSFAKKDLISTVLLLCVILSSQQVFSLDCTSVHPSDRAACMFKKMDINGMDSFSVSMAETSLRIELQQRERRREAEKQRREEEERWRKRQEEQERKRRQEEEEKRRKREECEKSGSSFCF